MQCLARTVTADTTLHGRTVPAGRKVLLLYGAANRDPRAFGPDADRLDLTRDGPQHLAFTHGPRAARTCAGTRRCRSSPAGHDRFRSRMRHG
ncbi:cytochrome P450 [Streptomyces noursei]|uniref:cytochrome P450 n=1 Tax=Streptomyces noursei TaxID=1971 RepID=UPI0037FF59A0